MAVYAKRYAGGFADGSAGATPIDSVFLNAVEAALLALYGTVPATNGALVWDGTKFTAANLIKAAQIDPAAAIAKTQLAALGIVNTDVSGAAAIAYSKLNLTGQLLNADLAGSIATSKVLLAPYRKVTSKAVNTSVAATDLLNGEITIAANILGTTGMLRATLMGDFLQNVGSVQTIQNFQVVFGGTTQLDTGTGAAIKVPTSATRGWWNAVIEIQNLTAATQVISLKTFLTTGPGVGAYSVSSGSNFTTGAGTFALLGGLNDAAFAIGGAKGTIDTTTNKTLVFNVINGANNAAYETQLLAAYVEVFT